MSEQGETRKEGGPAPNTGAQKQLVRIDDRNVPDLLKFVNLTPHEVVIYSPDGKNIIFQIPPSGKVARVSVKAELVGYVNGVPIRKTTYGDIEGLPDQQPNTIYITSTIVLLALQAKGIRRSDVLSPDTNPDSVVRDASGKIIGVKYFQVV
jgi:hypothetical protein